MKILKSNELRLKIVAFNDYLKQLERVSREMGTNHTKTLGEIRIAYEKMFFEERRADYKADSGSLPVASKGLQP